MSEGRAGESTWPKQGAEYSTVEDNGKPLKVVCWNVAGILARVIVAFLGDLDEELQRDVFILR